MKNESGTCLCEQVTMQEQIGDKQYFLPIKRLIVELQLNQGLP